MPIVWLSLNRRSKFALNWFSRNRDRPEIGVKPVAVAAEGIANWPFGNFAFRTDTITGLIEATGRPNDAAKPAAVRLSSRNWGGMVGNIRLLFSEAPFRSRVPWYEKKKNSRSFIIGPPSVPPN